MDFINSFDSLSPEHRFKGNGQVLHTWMNKDLDENSVIKKHLEMKSLPVIESNQHLHPLLCLS